MNQLKIVINSHKHYQCSLDHLLESMKVCNEFYEHEIIIVIGGNEGDYEIMKENNITWIKTNINSFDHTALIALLELYNDTDNYYFFLHSTCKVGPQFFSKLNQIKIDNVQTIRINEIYYSMNIGVYSQNIINKNKDTLLSLKNTSQEENVLLEIKKRGFYYEDFIFKQYDNILNDNTPIISGPTDYYNTGTMRIIEYYPAIDLYKIKANWGQPGIFIQN